MSRPSWVARGLSVERVEAGTMKVPAGRVVSPDLNSFSAIWILVSLRA